MQDWDEQAEAIRTRLLTAVRELRDGLILQDAETESRPVTLPAVYVVMARAEFRSAGSGRTDAATTWQVLVRSKHMNGVTGALALADKCVDAIAGFEPGADCDPLTPVRCEYFGEATRTEPAYIITFTTMADQIPPEFFSTC